MFEEFQNKLLNPDISFLAIYVSIIVVLSYIGLLLQFLKIKSLKSENEMLKHQLSSQPQSKISLSKDKGIIS
jgi:hypothetical protein